MIIKILISFLLLYSTCYAETIYPFGKNAQGRTKFAVTNDTVAINMPYGMYYSLSDHTVTSTTVAYPISFNTVVAYNVSHSTTNLEWPKIQIMEKGTYLTTVSAIADSSGTNTEIELWQRVNGVNVEDSNTIVHIPNASTETTLAVSFLNEYEAGDYFELYYRGDATSVRLNATPAGTAPPRPACPSIIMTVNKIGE